MINIASFCNGFGYNMAQKMLPQFMEDILRLPISEVHSLQEGID